MQPTASSSDLLQSKQQQQQQQQQNMSSSAQKLARRSSISVTQQKQNQHLTSQRRQNLPPVGNDFLSSRMSCMPRLLDTMSKFFQSVQLMEEEVMLPSRLKDIPVQGKPSIMDVSGSRSHRLFPFLLELVLDNDNQPDNWHELYAFVRELRNQLQCTRPFADSEQQTSQPQERKPSNEDEGILILNHDGNQHSSASSTVSSDEFEQSTASSTVASYETIRDEVKYHYYGLLESMNTLSFISARVTEKYREQSTF